MALHDAAAMASQSSELHLAIVGLVTAAIGAVTYKFTKPAHGSAEAKDAVVVSATFSDRRTIEALTSALEAVNVTLLEANALLRVEQQHRHDEAVIREALRSRGITT